LLKFADYVGVLFGAKGRQRTITELIGSRSLTERSSKVRIVADLMLAAVYGSLILSAEDSVHLNACHDGVRGITSKTLEGSFWPLGNRKSGEYRLHKNFNLSAGVFGICG
jgi:hypothetical protein